MWKKLFMWFYLYRIKGKYYVSMGNKYSMSDKYNLLKLEVVDS